MFRYYLTQRPPMPGTFPNTPENKVWGVESFEERRLVPMLHRQAWGYVEYKAPLTRQQMKDYELSEAGPFYVNRETKETVSRQMMLYIYETEYDGDDPLNAVGWNEYFEEVEVNA